MFFAWRVPLVFSLPKIKSFSPSMRCDVPLFFFFFLLFSPRGQQKYKVYFLFLVLTFINSDFDFRLTVANTSKHLHYPCINYSRFFSQKIHLFSTESVLLLFLSLLQFSRAVCVVVHLNYNFIQKMEKFF